MALLRVTYRPPPTDPHAWMQGCDFGRIGSLSELDDYLSESLRSKTPVGVDFETTSLDVVTPSPDLAVVGVVFCPKPGLSRYVPVGHRVGYEKNLPWPEVLERLHNLDASGVPTVWHGGRYDHEVLHHTTVGVTSVVPNHWVPSNFEESLFALWLYDCQQKAFGLKQGADRVLGITMPTYKGLTDGRNFADIDPDECVIYGCSDGHGTISLWLHPGVQAAVTRQRQVYLLEKALLEPFRRTLRNGQWWDDAVLAAIEEDLGGEVKIKNKIVRPASGRIGRIREAILTMAGASFNFDAPAQVGEMLLRVGVPITERTDSEQVATGKEILQKYQCKHDKTCPLGKGDHGPSSFIASDCTCGHRCKGCHPIIMPLVMERELKTYDRNYVRPIRKAIAKYGPLLHFPFNQLGAPTGRMSGGGERTKVESGFVPSNWQSMPDAKKEKYLPDVRSGMVANDPRLGVADDDPEGFDIVAIDFSQIELRVAANLSKEPAWIQAFLDGIDIHLQNARLAYEEPTMPRYFADGSENPKRGSGKTMGFAVLFGATEETVAEHGGIPVEQAKTLLDNFWRGAPVLSTWIKTTHARARTEKVVKTFLGRERPLDEWYTVASLTTRKMGWLAKKGDREAVNTQIQGGAADIFKIAVVRADRLMTAQDWHSHVQMVGFLHDEVVFRVRRRLKADIVAALLKTMGAVQVTGWPVPIPAEAEHGRSWGGGLRAYKPDAQLPPTMAPCPKCQTPTVGGHICQTCREIEAQLGPVIAVARRVPIVTMDGPDPRITDRPRVAPLRLRNASEGASVDSEQVD